MFPVTLAFRKSNGDSVDFKTTERKCQTCSVVEITTQIMNRCMACKTALYCSKNCQKVDWKSHKIDCKRIQSGGANPIEIELKKSERGQSLFSLSYADMGFSSSEAFLEHFGK